MDQDPVVSQPPIQPASPQINNAGKQPWTFRKTLVIVILVVFFGIPLVVGIIEGAVSLLPARHYTATIVSGHLNRDKTPSIVYTVRSTAGNMAHITQTCVTWRYQIQIPCVASDIIKPGTPVTVEVDRAGSASISRSSWTRQVVMPSLEFGIPAVLVIGFTIWFWWGNHKMNRVWRQLEEAKATQAASVTGQGPSNNPPLQ